MTDVLIIGCGYTGRRIARLELADGHTVVGLVFSDSSAGRLRTLGATPLQADLDTDSLPVLRGNHVYYCAPPPRRGESDPRLARVLASLQDAMRLVYLSTTGVYGDREGALVTEDTPVNPGTDRARRRVAAERSLERWARDTGNDVVILRVAGVYGPGRLPLVSLTAGDPVLQETESGPGNRIHVDDLATVALAAMRRGRPGRIYNVTDGNPMSSAAFADAVADAAGLPRPPRIDMREAAGKLPERRVSFLRERRRVSNERMLRELKVALHFTDPVIGIHDSLQRDA